MARIAMLICGLPRVGKTTISKRLAPQLGAVYLRIDEIEQAILDAKITTSDIYDAGYRAAAARSPTCAASIG